MADRDKVTRLAMSKRQASPATPEVTSAHSTNGGVGIQVALPESNDRCAAQPASTGKKQPPMPKLSFSAQRKE